MNSDDHGGRERELAARLRELADAAVVPDAGAMEERLARAFDELHAAAAPGARRRRVVERAAWRPLAAAAVLALLATGLWNRMGSRPLVPVTPAPPPSRIAAPPPPVATPGSPPPAAAPAPVPAPRQRPPGRRARPVEDTSHLAGFVALPEAAALPAFESGRIVRVEVPLASLPAYGLDLVPDATPTRVEADLLVGQDGLPRAIRLASTMSTRRSR